MFRPRLITTWVVIMMLLLATPAWAVTVEEVDDYLMCQCGCSMIVTDCSCGTAASMRTTISQFIAQGMGKREILEKFVGVYGEKVLASPLPKGFNLTAWILPALAVTGGIVLIIYALYRWVPGTRDDDLEVAEDSLFLDQEEKQYYRELLAEQLKKTF